MKDELSNLEAVTVDDMEGFLSVAGRLDAIEEKFYYQIIEERLAVITRLTVRHRSSAISVSPI